MGDFDQHFRRRVDPQFVEYPKAVQALWTKIDRHTEMLAQRTHHADKACFARFGVFYAKDIGF
jgi:hypothetical protein